MLAPDVAQSVLDASTPIFDKGDVRRFFKALLAAGVNFHPDTSFDQYVNAAGTRLFSDEDATVLDTAMEATFDVADCDPYEVAVEEFQAYFAI